MLFHILAHRYSKLTSYTFVINICWNNILVIGIIDYDAFYFKCKTPPYMRREPINKALN